MSLLPELGPFLHPSSFILHPSFGNWFFRPTQSAVMAGHLLTKNRVCSHLHRYANRFGRLVD